VSTEPVREVACPLCGRHFPAREACPSGCPLAAHCHSLCCPHCHYSFIEDDSAVVRLMRSLFGRRPR